MAEAFPPDWQPLVAAEQGALLRLARHSILTFLHGEGVPAPPTPTRSLLRPTAAFVSLHVVQTLRGCVGTTVASQPLHVAVATAARAAAFDDPRFPPLAEAELDEVQIEISRLSPLRAAQPDDVCPGRHGACVRVGKRNGVFLPQVATLYKWDRETLLGQLCLKAGLPSDAWQWPEAELMLFEAEVFGETDDRQQKTDNRR